MGFWEWFAKVALDGIGAGVVGGLVTWGAVVWTLRSDRKATAEAELRAKAGALAARSTAALRELVDRRSEAGRILWEVQTELIAAEAAGAAVAPAFARDLGQLSNELSRRDQPLARDAAVVTAIAALVSAWVSDPKRYEKRPAEPANELFGELDRMGESIAALWAKVDERAEDRAEEKADKKA